MLETEKYWIVAAMGLFAVMVPTSLIVASYLLSKARVRPQTPPDQMPSFMRATYESGMAPVGGAQVQFNFRFYLFALLFVIFDVETVFMFPWAVIFDKLLLFGLIEMLVFIFILVVGYYYAWQKGALEWV